MSYLKYNPEDNSIYVCKGHSKFFNKLQYKNENENFGILTQKNTFKGIKIKNFLSELELDGLKCEKEFKILLEKNNVPFLYIGQGPYGIERSGVLIEQTKSKRADFILNIPDLGTILFDVKCRTKIGFKQNGQKYFHLFVSELEALYNLQKLILMPVWIAFCDRELINSNIANKVSHFLPISMLYKFWKSIYNNYFENKIEFKDIKVIRIPYELLTKIENNKITFNIGYSKIKESLIKEFAIKNIGLNRKLKDSIKQKIRESSCFKSDLPGLLAKQTKDFLLPKEIEYAVENLIEQEIIDYEPRKQLKLVGE